MVLGNIFSRGLKTSKGIPRFNVPYGTNITESIFGSGNLNIKKSMINLFKTIPELNALVTMVASDIVGEYDFVPLDEKKSGRNKIKAAQKYAVDNDLTGVMLAQTIDGLALGEGYAWMKGISSQDLKEIVDAIVLRKIGMNNLEMKEEIANKAFLRLVEQKDKYLDESLVQPRLLRYIASSTMDIDSDDKEIKRFVQKVGVTIEYFKPEEILHLSFLQVDGKPFGFSPVSTLFLQLDLLKLMWKNQKALQTNGGSPGKIFAFEDLKVASPAYKRIEEQLTEYSVPENQYGNMLMTGKLNVVDIQKPESMMFKDVGLYVTGVIAMHWCIPKSRIPFIVGGTNTANDVGGTSEKTYWISVERKQDRLAQLYNAQLFIPKFGVKLVHKKDYQQDDVAENTALQLRLGNLEMMNRLLAQDKKKLTLPKKLILMGLEEDHVEDVSDEELNSMATGMLRQNMLPQREVTRGSEDQNVSDQKKREQLQTTKNRGKPLGV